MDKIIIDGRVYISADKLIEQLEITDGFGPKKIGTINGIIQDMDIFDEKEGFGIKVDLTIKSIEESNVVENVTTFVSDTADNVQKKAKEFYNSEDVKESASQVKNGVFGFAKATASLFKKEKIYGPVEPPKKEED